MATTQSDARTEPGYFPPITAHDWSAMEYGEPTAINPNAARMVYDVCWFILKDGDAAIDTTVVTFRIALSRFNDHKLPPPEAYTSWLSAIASNEAHRVLEEDQTVRHSSALLEGDAERPAHFLADALSELRADHKLLMLLRYRYNTSAEYMSKALDMRPRRLAKVLSTARADFTANSTHAPTMLAGTNPPLTRQLPILVEPYGKKEMKRAVLGYEWLRGSDFPLIPERDEVRTKWITLALTVLLVIMIAVILNNSFGAERPTLIEPGAVVENGMIENEIALDDFPVDFLDDVDA